MTENITQPPLKPMRQVMEEVIREAATVTPYGKARYQMLKSGKISSSSLVSALQIYDLRRPDDLSFDRTPWPPGHRLAPKSDQQGNCNGGEDQERAGEKVA